MTCIHIVGC